MKISKQQLAEWKALAEVANQGSWEQLVSGLIAEIERLHISIQDAQIKAWDEGVEAAVETAPETEYYWDIDRIFNKNPYRNKKES